MINFFKTWSEEMAYILGYWFADGSIWESSGYRFNIVSNDLKHLEKIKDIIYPFQVIYHRKDDNSHEFRITDKELYNDLIALGGVVRKSLVAKFPNIPNEYLSSFIRGYFDGDGSIYSPINSNEPRISFCGTKEFLEELSNKLPYKSNVELIRNKTYRIYYTGEYAKDVLEFMYKDSHIHLERKYKRFIKSKLWKRQRKLRCDSNLYKLNGYPIGL